MPPPETVLAGGDSGNRSSPCMVWAPLWSLPPQARTRREEASTPHPSPGKCGRRHLGSSLAAIRGGGRTKDKEGGGKK